MTASLPFAHHIDWFWCDPAGMYFRGWIHCYGKQIKTFAIRIGEDHAEISSFQDRSDIQKIFIDSNISKDCGFEIYVPGIPGKPVSFHILTEDGEINAPIDIPRQVPPAPPQMSSLYAQFIETVNQQKLTVLELGSRLAGAMTTSHRQFFPGASRYIGMDVHAAPSVDLVGDVHELSSLVGAAALDAIFSIAVLEHLERPWIAADEMNRALKPGGIIFHSTVQAWPIHDSPNDFWRFSDEGLKVLFGPSHGFEVIGAIMQSPVHIYPRDRSTGLLQLPLNPGYAEAAILSRKVNDISANAEGAPNRSRERALQYPLRNQE